MRGEDVNRASPAGFNRSVSTPGMWSGCDVAVDSIDPKTSTETVSGEVSVELMDFRPYRRRALCCELRYMQVSPGWFSPWQANRPKRWGL